MVRTFSYDDDDDRSLSAETVEVSCYLVRETPGAWGVANEPESEDGMPPLTWLPKSRCKLRQDYAGKCWVADVPEWLAKKEGLI